VIEPSGLRHVDEVAVRCDTISDAAPCFACDKVGDARSESLRGVTFDETNSGTGPVVCLVPAGPLPCDAETAVAPLTTSATQLTTAQA